MILKEKIMTVVNIDGKIENNNLSIILSGKVDSSNAGDAEKQVMELLGDNSPTAATIDAEKLEYISSAGLRILLKLKKKIPKVTVINVTSEVYDIFEVTGFTEILDVQKAYRCVSIEGCPEIGRGAYGTVYRLSEDSIVKVYRVEGANSIDIIKREQENARKAFVYGMPTAISYDIVKVGNDMGVVYEMLDAQTVGSYITEHPEEFDQRIQQIADLARSIHATVVKNNEFQSFKEFIIGEMEHVRKWVNEEQFQQILDTIAAIPDPSTLLHGDFHPKNTLIRNGEIELIDMGDVRVGHPIFEFSSMCMLDTLLKNNPQMQPWQFMGTDEATASKVWPAFIKSYLGDKFNPQTAELLIKAAQIGMLIKVLPSIAARVNAAPEPRPESIAMLTSRIETLLAIKPEMIAGLFKQVDALLQN